jgi:hypothetical protein
MGIVVPNNFDSDRGIVVTLLLVIQILILSNGCENHLKYKTDLVRYPFCNLVVGLLFLSAIPQDKKDPFMSIFFFFFLLFSSGKQKMSNTSDIVIGRDVQSAASAQVPDLVLPPPDEHGKLKKVSAMPQIGRGKESALLALKTSVLRATEISDVVFSKLFHLEGEKVVFSTNEAVLREAQAVIDSACANHNVLKEANVELDGASKKICLTERHLEIRDFAKKKRVSLLCVVVSRLPGQSLKIVTEKSSYILVFASGAEADEWQLELLEARLRCVSLALDLVPSFRVVLSRPKQVVPASYHQGLDVSNAALGSPGKGDLDLMKTAILGFEKLNMGFHVALDFGATFAQDMEARLGELQRLGDSREGMRKKIRDVEIELSTEEKMSLEEGQILSNTLGNSLKHVGVVHSCLAEAYKDILNSAQSSFITDEQKDEAKEFIASMDVVGSGLLLNVPLKGQLQEFMSLEEQGRQELREMEAKYVQMETLLATLRRKRVLLVRMNEISGEIAAICEKSGRALENGGSLSQVSAFAEKAKEAVAQLPSFDDSDASSPTGVLKGLFATTPDHDTEQAILRCFDYFLSPMLLMEFVTVSFCSGGEVVRIRALHFLKRWLQIHPYHFAGDKQLETRLKDLLACARLMGHENLVRQVEAESSVVAPVFVGILDSSFRGMTKLYDVHPREIARQLTLIDFGLYSKIQTREFLHCNFMKPSTSPHIANLSAQFNRVANIVIATILTATDNSACVVFWISVMRHLRVLHNYQSVLAVLGGLMSAAIHRLKRCCWEKVAGVEFVEECKSLMDKNFVKLRKEVESLAPRNVVPYIGIYQRDLVFLEEAATFTGSILNMSKLKDISAAVVRCLVFQCANSYSWMESSATVARLIAEHKVFSDSEAFEMSLKLELRDDANSQSKGLTSQLSVRSFSGRTSPNLGRTSPSLSRTSPKQPSKAQARASVVVVDQPFMDTLTRSCPEMVFEQPSADALAKSCAERLEKVEVEKNTSNRRVVRKLSRRASINEIEDEQL